MWKSNFFLKGQNNPIVNPYFCGSEVGGEKAVAAFVGRESILENIRQSLNNPNHNGLWLYGRARIGKTSILKKLETELSKESTYLPIFYSFKPSRSIHNRLIKRISKDTVLSELIKKINIELPDIKDFDTFLKEVKSLKKKIIFLFDEFQDSIMFHENQSTNEEMFSDYLQETLLKLDPKNINFVIASRNHDKNHIIDFFREFSAREQISLFNSEDTKRIIDLSDNKLSWSESAVERVYEETKGHPLLTQCLCGRIWDDKIHGNSTIVEEMDVEQAISNLNNMDKIGGIAAIWDDLSESEQIVLLAIAKAMPDINKNKIMREDVENILGNYKLPKEIILQKIIPLSDSDYLTQKGNTFQFKIKLLGRWLTKNPENQGKLEEMANKLANLYSGNKSADGYYMAGVGDRDREQFDDAVKSFERADKIMLETGDIHLGANKNLVEISYEQGKIDEALKIVQSIAKRKEISGLKLIELLKLKNSLSADKKAEFWQGILKIYPDYSCLIPECWEQKGNEAHKKGDLDKAQEYYENANLMDRVAQVKQEIMEKAKQKGDLAKVLGFVFEEKLTQINNHFDQKLEDIEKSLHTLQSQLTHANEQKQWLLLAGIGIGGILIGMVLMAVIGFLSKEQETIVEKITQPATNVNTQLEEIQGKLATIQNEPVPDVPSNPNPNPVSPDKDETTDINKCSSTYEVQEGNNYTNIAYSCYTDYKCWTSIAEKNWLLSLEGLHKGDKLKMPVISNVEDCIGVDETVFFPLVNYTIEKCGDMSNWREIYNYNSNGKELSGKIFNKNKIKLPPICKNKHK
ncbi:ATP-binding protein [Candidatus Parabeggiatoa sp. HSG14]|uniref:ATP-binding protein n=1 Tax=Candidatus Parabeggiatoa sp. HSG14 TaxID=3055593 RepID=UPI0025A867C7|nr:hypothetical protein [Thiotrichales bacterium HSG14]